VLIASLAVTHVFSPPFGVSQMFAAHQASQWNRQQTIDTIQAAMQRQRLMLPPHPVMAQLVQEAMQAPPTEDEIRVLAEVIEEAQEQNLAPEQIKTRLRDLAPRIWQLLKVIAKNDVRIATDLMLLFVIFDHLVGFFPAQPPTQPAPQVTVNVTVDADEIAERVAKRLKDEGVCVVPEPTSEVKPKPHK
jgi:hypothetical protein